MNRLLTAPPSGSTEGWQGIGAICGIPSVAVGDAASDSVPTAEIRHALRALASETGPLTGRGVKLLRPLVAQAHEVLRERLEAGGSVEAYLRDRARLADSAVIGLLHIASVSTRMRGGNMVAPLAVAAAGGYGRGELAPGSDLDLLFLLPESNRSRGGAVATATETCIKAVIAGLWDLGFVLDHAARSPRECLDLAREEPAVLASSSFCPCRGSMPMAESAAMASSLRDLHQAGQHVA